MKNLYKVLVSTVFIATFGFGQVDYQTQIQTIFNNNCTSCHINGGAYYGGLDLSSYDSLMVGDSQNGPVVIAGDHASSLLWQKVNSGAMPPQNNPDLSTDEVSLIAQWIDEGALLTPAYEGPVWHVATTGSDETGDGSEESPFATIQKGIDAASNGDTVLVAAGTYEERIINEGDMYGNEEHWVIIGASGADSTFLIPSTDAPWNEYDGAIYVLYDGSLYIDGFTIIAPQTIYSGTNAKKISISNSVIRDNSTICYFGGGNIDSSIVINNCTLINNENVNLSNNNGNTYIKNSIIYDNDITSVDENRVEYSLIEGYENEDNHIIDTNPLFCNPASGDYTLAENSPCVGTGQDSANMGAFGVGCGAIFTPPELVINEFLASNEACCIDNNGDYDDYIEIYNYGDEAVDIGGLFITDEIGNYDDYYQLPAGNDSTIIQPGDFLLLWADKESEQGVLHVEIKLSNDGEQIGLFMPDSTTVVDTLTFGEQSDDISYGRYPDGSDTWQLMNPTPGASNTQELSLDEALFIPEVFVLHQNYPNPFNPVTTLQYDLPENAMVNITIYDMMGRQVKTLVNGSQTAGYKFIQWNATNDEGKPVSAGLYLYTIQAGEFRQTKKMVLLK